jgi:transcriptional regulator of acetoin/glycerol metabolism
MLISGYVLSDDTRADIAQDISDAVGVDRSDVVVEGVYYNLSGESLNLKDVTRRTLIKAIARSRGKITASAKALGVTRKTLYAMIERYGLESVVNMHE